MMKLPFVLLLVWAGTAAAQTPPSSSALKPVISPMVQIFQGNYGTGDVVAYKNASTYYTFNTINKVIKTDTDRSLLCVSIAIADARFDTTLSRAVRDTCAQLFDLANRCVNSPRLYHENIRTIEMLLRSIFIQNQESRKGVFHQKLAEAYQQVRKENFLVAIRSLGKVSEDDSAFILDSYLYNEIQYAWKKDSTLFMGKVVMDNVYPLLRVFTLRAGRTASRSEVDILFYAINTFIGVDYRPDWDDYITSHLSDALRPPYDSTKAYLSNFLLEGYKSFLSNRKIPKKPTVQDVKMVYEFVMAGSEKQSLSRNALIAQAALLEQGVLTCSEKINEKIEKGWNWQSEEVACKRPFLMLTRTANELNQLSLYSDAALNFNSPYFIKGKECIALFNYKFKIFSGLQRFGHVDRDIFQDQILTTNLQLGYGPCAHLGDAILVISRPD